FLAYGDYTDDLFLLPLSGGEPRSIPGTKDLDIIRWAPDGRSFYGSVIGSVPVRVIRVDAASGRREPWKELAPPELAGLIEIGNPFLTPDGKSYAFHYVRAATSDLYVIEGLK
ncbi:MAG TPA: hypothetical protein VH854_11175, partial [Thermoanaerobaculia bacterium]|nr:hypothetical protein [Thermoanaerobaculia bacterium]